MSGPARRTGAPLPPTALVVGFARTGSAVARVLGGRGVDVVAVDDVDTAAKRAEADRLGVALVTAPGAETLQRLAAEAGIVVVSPGVPPTYPVLSQVPPERVVSEVELAFRLGGPPLVAVTGTNGKTTVTSLVADMLARSGLRVRAAGNIGYPLVEAVCEDVDVVVAEVSSFQLALTSKFRPWVGTWLNLAEDHLDWHRDLDEYVAAKSRIWARQEPGDVAVANADDPVVLDRARRSAGRLVTFGLEEGDVRLDGDVLLGPGGQQVASVADMVRAMPHDRANALAAIATAMSAGATPAGVRAALRSQPLLRHRVEMVRTVEGVDYVDDSKATTPSAVAAALAGLTSVVLVAGGRNKGLDLHALAEAARGRARPSGAGAPSARVRSVVAIGEAAAEITEVFSPDWVVVTAVSMDDAVAKAAQIARPGDTVLLSPGCASFDWYSSYEQRGEDFVRAVGDLARTRAGARTEAR